MRRGVIDTPRIFWSQILRVRSGIVFITVGCFIISWCWYSCTAQCSTMQICKIGGSIATSIEVLFSVALGSAAALLPRSAWVSVPHWVCWGDVRSSILHVFTDWSSMCYCMWPLVPLSSTESSNKSLMAVALFLGWYLSFPQSGCCRSVIYIGPFRV